MARRTPPGTGSGSSSGGTRLDAWCADPAPCPRAPAPRAAISATTHVQAAPRSSPAPSEPGGQRHRDQRVAGRGVVGEPAVAQRHAGTDPLADTALERGPSRPAASRSRSAERARAGAPSIASYTVCQPVHRHRCAARARSRSTRRVLPLGLRGRDPHEDPGRAEPALRAAGGHEPGREVVAHRAVEPVDGRHRPAVDARGRRDARDARFAVDQHRAAPALALRRAPVLHRDDAESLAQHREQRLARDGVDLDLLTVARELHPMPRSGHGQAG